MRPPLGLVCVWLALVACEGRARAPAWTQVSAGDVQTCGARAGTLTCWGGDEFEGAPHTSDTGAWVDYGDDTIPEGSFYQVAIPSGGRGVGSWHICGGGRWMNVCWGRHEHGQNVYPPDGRLALTRASTCGLNSEGWVRCRGLYMGSPSNKRFLDLAAGLDNACAAHEDGYVACFGPDGPFPDRPGAYTAVGIWDHACAVAPGAPISCWDVPTGADWTPDGLPGGIDYVDLCVGGEDGGCALDAAGRAHCWGPYLTDAPDVTFTQLSCGNTHACGVTDRGALACWGLCEHGQCDVPP